MKQEEKDNFGECSSCTQLGALRQRKEILYATKSGMGLNLSVGNFLIDMYNKCIDVDMRD